VPNLIQFSETELQARGFETEFPVVVADIEVVPPTLNFGDVEVLSASTQVITVANVGSGELLVADIAFDAPISPAFAQVPSEPLPATLLPEETLDIEITFAPTAIGATSAILQITSTTPINPSSKSC